MGAARPAAHRRNRRRDRPAAARGRRLRHRVRARPAPARPHPRSRRPGHRRPRPALPRRRTPTTGHRADRGPRPGPPRTQDRPHHARQRGHQPMSTGWALIISVLLLIGNAFFVAAEFALTAAKRYRLEDDAAAGSRAARAAIKGIDQLSLMLAGAQLGITLCTLGLGALAEPAIAHLIDPLLHATGM